MDFNPQAGHEQAGRRPAIVVSNNTFNHHSTMAMVCPITNTDNKHPLHIPLDDRTRTTGVILCEQVKSLDVRERNAYTAEKAPTDIVEKASSMVKSLLE